MARRCRVVQLLVNNCNCILPQSHGELPRVEGLGTPAPNNLGHAGEIVLPGVPRVVPVRCPETHYARQFSVALCLL